MDRQIVYPGSIPLDTDILNAQRFGMLGLGFLAQATLGTTTVVDGLAATQTTVASMTINIGPGSIVSLATVDASSFGSLAADSNPLVKIGINESATPFTLTAPSTSGQSISYLIEATFLEADATPVVLPYYNASNPASPYSGPAGAGTPQNTQRTQRVSLQLLAGVAATTGTQTPPPVTSGWTALYVITVNYGQTTVTTAQITKIVGAPWANEQMGTGARAGRLVNVQVFTASGTYTPSPGSTHQVALVVGGGGSGGSTGTSVPWAAAGGGAGGAALSFIANTAAQTITVGSGGSVTAGSTSTTYGNNGNNGNTSSFGSLLSATGGGGGTGATGGVCGGAIGGIGSGGNIFNIRGGSGTDGNTNASSFALGGNGGNSIFGGAGRAANGTNSAANGGAPGAGSGASYGSASLASGAPSAGIVIVWELS